MKRAIAMGAAGLSLAAPLAGTPAADGGERQLHRAGLVFPLHALHNHSSCLLQTPNGDLLVAWYRGSGERRADDVEVLGARRRAGSSRWSRPFPMADVPGFPDCNPAIGLDSRQRLWLFWPVILANEWHTALLMSRVSERYQRTGAPIWSRERVVFLKPGPEFAEDVSRAVDEQLANLDALPEERRSQAREYLETRRRNAADRYFSRMGWMPRAHPLVLDDGRLLLPLYSDGFDFSLIAYSDDHGETWSVSRPLVSMGGVQPSLVQRRDGTLVAYMRDNGPPPKRVLTSESSDRGLTWSPVVDSEIPNPGAGLEVIRLRSGLWAMINNDTERGRHQLAVSLSEDEGRTWRWTRYLERDAPGDGAGSYHYPSLIQAADGTLHASYTFNPPAAEVRMDREGRPLRAAIKHAQFNEAWIRAGAE